jgi:serine/threonine-protein kinase
LPVKPGDILEDRLRIDALIGRGGMGQVFSATDLHSPDLTQVAVKVVSRLLVDDILMARLQREAEAAQRIQSDFVPRVFDIRETRDGETYLVMERLIGEPLSQRIREHGALPWTEVALIGDDILHGLIDAHAAGIIHRDLKPSNVFLAVNGGRMRAMVLDFGVCKIYESGAERLTGTGESIGTVAYMAPEQIRGAARVDERADLYAFGVLVFEMLSGRLPHDGPSQMAILASKLENSPPRLKDCARVTIPDGLDAIIDRVLARDPAARFGSADEILRAWRALAGVNEVIAAISSRNLVDASSDDVNGAQPGAPAGVDPPTEIARGARLAGEPHPTQTGLTTHHTAIGRSQSHARVAIVVAACGLVAGIAVIGISLSRGDAAPARPALAPAASSGEIAAVPAARAPARPPEEPAEPAPELAAPVDAGELPADPAPAAPAGAAPRPKPVFRPHPPARPPAPAPRASGPRITNQPRY